MKIINERETQNQYKKTTQKNPNKDRKEQGKGGRVRAE